MIKISSKKMGVRELQSRVKELKQKLAQIQEETALSIKVRKTNTRFKRVKNPHGPDIGIGEFFMQADITAVHDTVYIPLSIASGKKQTGFIYHIEGTAKGDISTTDIKVKGPGITNITLGTLLYSKIPAGKTATFRILIEIRGKMQNTYSVVINSINYKLDPTDARYKKFDHDIQSSVLRMK